MKFFLYAFLFCFLLAPLAQAATPDYLTVGAGSFDFDKKSTDRRSVDARLEYQWGVSLLPKLSHSLKNVDFFLQIHPTIGVEANTHGATYANAGFNLDMPLLWRHMVLTWGETAGIYTRGNDSNHLGYPLEFRSQLELGWRFRNDVRVSGYISHISNAHLGTENPGAEVVGGALRLPIKWGK